MILYLHQHVQVSIYLSSFYLQYTEGYTNAAFKAGKEAKLPFSFSTKILLYTRRNSKDFFYTLIKTVNDPFIV